MSIINEQNILGNPELADVSRPGSDVTIADYSFGTGSGLYEKIMHEAMGLARGGSWTQPTSYSGEVAQAEVEGEASSEEVGVAGVPTQSSPPQYGGPGDAPLSENATQKTKITQAATIMAAASYADNFVNKTSSAVRSETIATDGVQGPETSGGQFYGYDASDPYAGWGNMQSGNGATSQPVPLEKTGIQPYCNWTAIQDAGPGDTEDPQPKKKKAKKKTGSSQARRAQLKARYRVHRRMGGGDRQSLKNPMTQKSTNTSGEDYLQYMLG